MTGSFFYALGTLVWQKSTLLYTHVPTLFLLLFASLLAVSIKCLENSKGKLITVGFLCGISTFFEYNSVIPAAIITLYLFCIKQTIGETLSNKKLLSLTYMAAFLIGITPLLVYNTVYFDNPFTTSYSYKLHFDFYKDMNNLLSGNLLSGLNDYILRFDRFFKYRNETPGLLALSPIFLFSFAGFFTLYKKRWKETILFFLLFFIPLCLLSMHPTPLVRYLTPYLPFLFIPGVTFLEFLWKKNSLYSKVIIVLYFLTGLLSIRNIYYNNNHFWGHSSEIPFAFFNNELSTWFIFCLPFLLIFYVILAGYLKELIIE